jgi:hypothetical protein
MVNAGHLGAAISVQAAAHPVAICWNTAEIGSLRQ